MQRCGVKIRLSSQYNIVATLYRVYDPFQIKPEENAIEMIFTEVRNIPYINDRLDTGYRIKTRDDRWG
ncbi:MAG: hypothetical protein ACI965_000025 [Paraglaciecola sp.]|jgi:hypothetical protein